jgi:hypothetical protein
MKLGFKNYNLLCIPIIFGLIVIYIVCDINFNNGLGVRLPLKEQDYVLYFGDSISFTVGECDSGNTTIYDWLQKETQTTILPIVKGGYSPIVYKDIISAFVTQKVLPKMIIIPINMRIFMPGWYTRPSFDYPLIRIKSKIKYENYNLNDISYYLKLRFSNVLTKEMNLWEKQEIVYKNFNLGVLSELHKKMKIKEDLDCNPNLKETYSYELELLFKYHYMYDLDESHKMLSYLKDTIEKARSRKVKTVLYITPLNYIDGERYVGKKFKEKIAKNIDVIKKILDSEKVDYIDLSRTIQPKRFVDQNRACGHLNNEGRKYIAQQLAVNFFR